jgi:hypothetical protein
MCSIPAPTAALCARWHRNGHGFFLWLRCFQPYSLAATNTAAAQFVMISCCDGCVDQMHSFLPPLLLLLLSAAAMGKDANPLAHVLQAIGEPLECVQYNTNAAAAAAAFLSFFLFQPLLPPMLLLLLLLPLLLLQFAARGKDANPLAHVLQAIGEPLECVQYNTWNVLVPEGQFLTRVGTAQSYQLAWWGLTILEQWVLVAATAMSHHVQLARVCSTTPGTYWCQRGSS